MAEKEQTVQHVEDLEGAVIRPAGTPGGTTGTVVIIDSQDIFLIPAPTADPRGDIIKTPSIRL